MIESGDEQIVNNNGLAPILKYPGSKWNIAEWIVQHMPAHTTYLEPYFGSGAVLFNKCPSKIETINDLDGDVVNLFRIIRDKPEELAYAVETTPWARLEYESIRTSAKNGESYIHTGNELEDARRFLVRCWMAFGAKTSDRTGWAHHIQEKYTSITERWNRLPRQIRLIAGRLKDVQIENKPALELIEKYRKPDVLIYADPPYLLSARNRRLYRHEMSESDHMELLDSLDKHPGPVLLSGYANTLYDLRLCHWDRKTVKTTAELGKTRMETLWINPVAAAMISGVLEFEF